MSNTAPSQDTEVLEKTEEQIEEPPMYACVLLNDDYTTMEFVIEALMSVFNKTLEEAVQLTIKIHHEDEGVAGIFPKQIAEFKQKKVMDLAYQEDHPLKCILRKESPSNNKKLKF